MIIVYKRISAKEINNSIPETIQKLKDWFQTNPKRRVCNAELWYGKRFKIKLKTIEEQVKTAAKEAIG